MITYVWDLVWLAGPKMCTQRPTQRPYTTLWATMVTLENIKDKPGADTSPGGVSKAEVQGSTLKL